MRLHLGQRSEGGALELPVRAMLRHVMALGSSGSGKTVLCKVVVEEAVRCGIPVICIDPQGDLSSLAVDSPGGDDAGDAAREFRERADVVVFTPASRKGVALCADPLGAALGGPGGGPGDATGAEAMQARTRAADMIVSLLGYDLDSDEGAGLRAVLDTVLADMDSAGRPASRLEHLSEHFAALSDADVERYGRYLDVRKIRTAAQRLARLDVGARRLLFHEGLPIDIDVLLGRGERAPAPAGKSRVSVIYLNTLHSQEDKDFFIAALVERLYGWMLKNPSSEPQALFYIDEVAPFVPPVRKPACKPGLSLLFKQARKYGVCCLMATQNPGDVDYKAMAQFGTWALGRLTTRQDMKKVEPIVKSLAPEASDAIMAALPARRPGEFSVLSPDHFDDVPTLATRWLYSAHETLDEDRIEALADERWRQRFEPGQTARKPEPGAAGRSAGLAQPTGLAHPTDEESIPSSQAQKQTSIPSSQAQKQASIPSSQPQKPTSTPHTQAQPDADPHTPLARKLAARKSMSAGEFAERTGMSERKARTALTALVKSGHARSYKDGRTTRYFATSTGARPDLGLGKHVAVIRPMLDATRVHELARDLERSTVLGLLGLDDDEIFDSAHLFYRPVYQVAFEEHIERTGLKRLLGPDRDQVVGTVYCHPRTLQILVFTPRRGIEFSDQPGPYASRVDDFDGVATFDDVPPGTLDIDEDAWTARRDTAAVKKHIRGLFGAVPRAVTPYFVPLWRIMLRQPKRGNYRVVIIDAVVGQPVSWP